MNLQNILVLCLAAATTTVLKAETLLHRSGAVNGQCCEFAAFAISWNQIQTWTDVRVDLDLYNNGEVGEPQTGVALLLNSLGPGTTSANEIDDAVVQTDIPGQQTVTLFQGLILGPGTYHLVYYRVSHSFADYLSAAWRVGGSPIAGPGITRLPDMIEDSQAPYRPASTWTAVTGFPALVHITGNPVPEPSGVAMFLLSAAGLLCIRRHR